MGWRIIFSKYFYYELCGGSEALISMLHAKLLDRNNYIRENYSRGEGIQEGREGGREGGYVGRGHNYILLGRVSSY